MHLRSRRCGRRQGSQCGDLLSQGASGSLGLERCCLGSEHGPQQVSLQEEERVAPYGVASLDDLVDLDHQITALGLTVCALICGDRDLQMTMVSRNCH